MEQERQTFTGDWQCSGCQKPIRELPFQPRSTANLLCRDCHAKKREASGGGNGGERKTFKGNWSCKDCGNAITELPFEPRSTANLVCRDCYRKSRA